MSPIKILVVDDEQVICSGCSMILTDLGHKVDTCMTCSEGIEQILRYQYDLILLDLKLPDQDGQELLKRVNKNDSTRVIVMTGYATVQCAVHSMKLGAIDFLEKPFTEDQLLTAVNNNV